jgi:hypothetical protein
LAHALDDIVTDIQDNSELKSVMIEQRCCSLGVTVDRPCVQIGRIFEFQPLHFSYLA